jgi:Fic family protein
MPKVSFQPQYELSQALLANVSQIERLYGQIEALQVPKKLELNLERDNQIQSAYVSNSIEGNPLSLREVTNLLLDDRVPVNRDEKEVRNYFDILKMLSQLEEEKITPDLANDLHQKLLRGVNDKIAGKIRNKKVVIGKYVGESQEAMSLEIKHEPPYHRKTNIIKALKKLCGWNEVETGLPIPIKAGIFHHHFVYLHPFLDGNGRVCRLLTALIFLQNDYRINRYFVLDDYYDIDRMQYSDKLHTADEGDKTEWLEYFTDGIRFSLQAALSRVKEAQLALRVEDRPSPKERRVLEIITERKQVTSSDLVRLLKVSRQQAYNLLKGLMSKGLIDKKGQTKKSYYFLK